MKSKSASLVLATSLAVLLAATTAQSADYKKFAGKSYDAVRGELIDDYWMPASPGCDATSKDLCIVYPELEICAGTGTAPCIFWWKSEDGKITLKINTDGESQREITGVQVIRE